MPEPRRKPRRTPNACVACRQSKVRCSGSQPCTHCTRRSLDCVFTDLENKIIVSEKYLRELQRNARRSSTPSTSSIPAAPPPLADIQPTSARNWASASSTLTESSALNGPASNGYPALPDGDHDSVGMDPFSGPSKTIKNPLTDKRQWIWLALWSTWSLTVRLSVMIAEGLYGPGQDTAPVVPDNAYAVDWEHYPADQPPDISGLPSFDHAVYLFNTAKFYLGQHYRFLEDENFVNHIADLYYGDTRRKAAEDRAWYAQFLITLAFGTAFVSQSRRNPAEPPGKRFFVRGMSLLPNVNQIWRQSLQAIETYALAALYLYSVDNREAAVLTIGQAVRMAQMEGLHTRLPESEIGGELARRCRSLWESLWSIDRHISTSTGLPLTTPESGAPLWMQGDVSDVHEDTILRLQAKLSNLMWVILCTLYKGEPTALGVFLDSTRTILQSLAGHAKEIEHVIAIKFGNMVPTMPKSTRHTTLLYHQCVMVATRPLLLLVLRERLENLHRGREDFSSFDSFLTLTTTLIVTGIRSAEKTIHILSNEETLLEMFLPFDLEFTHEAALYLLMARTLFPAALEEGYRVQEAYAVIDEMSAKGNLIAQRRKAELVRLEGFFDELVRRSEQVGLSPLSLGYQDVLDRLTRQSTPSHVLETCSKNGGGRMPVPAPHVAAIEPVAHPGMPVLGPGHDDEVMGYSIMDDVGISSETFLAIINQMSDQETLAHEFSEFSA